MTYRFTEYKYPEEHPDVDLDFNNDVIYSALVGNEINKKDIPDIITVDVLPAKSAKKHEIKEKQKSNSDIMLYIAFISVIIIIMLIWYLYGGKNEKKIEPIDRYADVAELTMLSPDLGMGSRYSKI